MDLDSIRQEVRQAINGLMEIAEPKPGQIVVLGCSTSEVLGKRIGSAGNVQVAEVILDEIMPVVKSHAVFLAVQCCEHLNRALVVEQEAADKYDLEPVTVYPVPTAGGATAGTAMNRFHRPVVVEAIRAHAGLDIGNTLIGMHIRPVAVPVRLPIKMIGQANLVLCRTRAKLIGGRRAVYALDKIEQKYPKSVDAQVPDCAK